jgi:hypothetical protein
MRKLTSIQKVTVAIAAGAVGVAASGVAYAYWTTSGTGSGEGSTAAAQATTLLSFTQNPHASTGAAQAVAAMYPGDSAQPLSVRVKNNGGQSAYVTGVAAYITTDQTGCDGTDFLIGGSSTGTELLPTPLTWTAVDLAANATQTATSTIQFNNKTGATAADQDACKGAVVTVNYVAS